MPLGKSGKYFMNPNEMKRQGDMPDAPAAKPLQEKGANEDEQLQGGGDGLEHHQIDEMPDGSAHSIHTAADGTTEEMDHDSYADACAAASGDSGEDEQGDEEEMQSPAKPPAIAEMGGESSGDMAGMYDQAQKRG